MRWVGGLWVAAIVLLLSGARVRADEPTGEPWVSGSLMDPDPLSPRAVAEAAEGELASAPSESAEPEAPDWPQEQRRARYRIAAGIGMSVSSVVHLAAVGASGLGVCAGGRTIVPASMVVAGLTTALGALLVTRGVRVLQRATPEQQAAAPVGQKVAALPIGLATLVGVQAGLWLVWAAQQGSAGCDVLGTG